MGDFFQNGYITTLHNLVNRPVEYLEADLKKFSKVRSMALVLPSLYSELQGDALDNIVRSLCEVDYLDEIIIGLDRADGEQAHHAQEYFGRLPQRHRILWHDGPRLSALDEELREEGLAPRNPGKGRNVWYCYGYVLASGRAECLGLHDCDILTYKRDLLARLMYPVANPNFSYQFCKGYYSRIAASRINGRVSRLLVTPLLRALERTFGSVEFLRYLDGFRYPLAGEFSMRVDLLGDLRIPSDWGLEIGMLSEVYRNSSTKKICQVDIAEVYDHKHQTLSPDDMSAGLAKMSVDITKTIFRTMASEGIVLDASVFRTIKATYFRIALDLVESYFADAEINGLKLDRHREEEAIETFGEAIMRAGEIYTDNPNYLPLFPNWNRVFSAIPDFLDRLYAAVEADNGHEVEQR